MTDPNPRETSDRAFRALAKASAALVEPYDVVGIVTRLLIDCAEATGAASGGLLVQLGQDELELLAATSHRAEEIEIYQLQSRQGPCFQAARQGVACGAADYAQTVQMWPGLGTAFSAAGYQSVRATPLRWHGDVIGALNLFWAGGHEDSIELVELIQAFADVATLAVVHSGQVPAAVVLERTKAALATRTVIEQAKGVIAYQRNLPMDAAFVVLLDIAERHRELLPDTATAIIAAAVSGLDDAAQTR